MTVKLLEPVQGEYDVVNDGSRTYFNKKGSGWFRGSTVTAEGLLKFLKAHPNAPVSLEGYNHALCASDIKLAPTKTLPKFAPTNHVTSKDDEMSTETTSLETPSEFFSTIKGESGDLIRAGSVAQVATRVSAYATRALVSRLPEDWQVMLSPVLQYSISNHIIGVTAVGGLVGGSWLLKGLLKEDWLIFAQTVARQAARGYLVLAGFDGTGAGIDLTLWFLKGLRKEMASLNADFDLGDLADFAKTTTDTTEGE